MSDVKAKARELLERMPDDCTLDDVLNHLYVLQRVEQGLGEVDAGQVSSHSQVEEELRRKWQVGRAG